jgi:hypothetical protein
MLVTFFILNRTEIINLWAVQIDDLSLYAIWLSWEAIIRLFRLQSLRLPPFSTPG